MAFVYQWACDSICVRGLDPDEMYILIAQSFSTKLVDCRRNASFERRSFLPDQDCRNQTCSALGCIAV